MDKEDTVNLLRSLVISKKGSCDHLELLKDFKEETGYSLPSFGYKTPLDFLKSIPDSLQLETHFQRIIVKAVDSAKSAHVASLIRRQNPTRRRHNVRSNCKRELLYNHKIYDKNYESSNSTMKAKKLDNLKCTIVGSANDSSVISSDSSLDKSKSPRSDCKVEPEFYMCKDQHSSTGEIFISARNFQGVQVNENVTESNIIKDMNDLPKLNLENVAKIGEYVEVCVPLVWNPHNFVLQLRKFKIKLANLVSEMQLFYNQNENKYKISNSELKSGLLCAALCTGNSECRKWYRAIIIEDTDNYNVVVGLIDYGTITEVNICNIRSLHIRYGKLPPQAISGHLANIRPKFGTVWPEESTDRFLSFVRERELIAGVVDVDCKEMWLSVALSFTDGTDVHISDTLVEENLAIFQSSGCDSRTCLPWLGSKGESSLHQPIPKFWFCPKVFAQSRKSQEEESSKSNTDLMFLSYSESNARLEEMFF